MDEDEDGEITQEEFIKVKVGGKLDIRDYNYHWQITKESSSLGATTLCIK